MIVAFSVRSIVAVLRLSVSLPLLVIPLVLGTPVVVDGLGVVRVVTLPPGAFVLLVPVSKSHVSLD